MKKHIPLMVLLAAGLLVFSACGKEKQPASSLDEPASSSLPIQKSDAKPEPVSPAGSDLSMSEARRLLAEGIDTDTYMVLDAKSNLEVDGDSYYVFIVAGREDNKAVGQIAVNKKTGEKFNYEGEGVLGAYSDFSLYDPEIDAVYDWEGLYSDGDRTVELLPIDDNSFEYTIGEITGVARIDGGKAVDEENDVTFSWDEGTNLVLVGAVVGTFTLSD